MQSSRTFSGTLVVFGMLAAALISRYHTATRVRSNTTVQLFHPGSETARSQLITNLLYPTPLVFLATCIIFCLCLAGFVQTQTLSTRRKWSCVAVGFGAALVLALTIDPTFQTITLDYLPMALIASLTLGSYIPQGPEVMNEELGNAVDEERGTHVMNAY